jgi:hypothetical protein
MGYFDDIVPLAGPGYAPQTAAVASGGTDNAPTARSGGFFDDIVPPAGPGSTLRFPADASKETDSPPLARTAGLFDHIVPPAPQATGPVAALTEAQIPQLDPMTGMPMPAPPLVPQSPGLPVRPETRAPLKAPTADWPEPRITPPRFGVPLAVPDPNALGEGFPAPPGPSAMDRIKAAAARGFGDEPLGFSEEDRAKYPRTYLNWQWLAAPIDFLWRAPGAGIGAISSAGSEIYKTLGGTETDANRLERDLNILGQSAMVEGGVGGRYNFGKPQANPFRTTAGAIGNEAAAAREAIGPTVPAATPRQSFAEASGQSAPNPRAGPEPPARLPDKAATQTDQMTSGARESGPSSLEGKEQDALRSEGSGQAVGIPAEAHAPTASASEAANSVPTAAAAESGPTLIGSFTPRADLKYGGTDFGNHAHREIGSMLRKLYKDAGLILRAEPGQRGIDVSVPTEHIAELGFAHAEIKPLSASGEKKLRQQVGKWGYDPSTVRAITYDANGNVHFGFR